MKKIEVMKVSNEDLTSYEAECFKKIKMDKTIYGLLLNSGFDDDSIKAHIGSCISFFNDYHKWEEIKTIDDVNDKKLKFGYKLVIENDTVRRESFILKPYDDYLKYCAKFIYKDFDDEFNSVRISDIQNKSLINNIKKELSRDKDAWIYIHGALRSGKTFCAIALINGSANNGNDNLAFLDFEKETQYLLKLSFDNKTKFEEEIDKIKNSHLLVLDNFGNGYINDIIRDKIVLPILLFRAQNRLNTIFTSDFNLDDVIGVFSESTKQESKAKIKQFANLMKTMIKTDILSSDSKLY